VSQTSDVNVIEASLNELLTNITFSLARLKLCTDNNVTVNTTEYLNTDDFSRPSNLILPYALCLAAGLIIVALGLWSMWQNGVSASDGFMKVMMATRGRTQMERLVLEQSGEFGDVDKASKMLKELKVRYCELVMVRIWGGGGAILAVPISARTTLRAAAALQRSTRHRLQQVPSTPFQTKISSAQCCHS
jgi:hypothetical protein